MAGASGSSGLAGASGQGGQPSVSCDDLLSETVDFRHPAYGCAHLRDSDPNDGESWISYDIGFGVDVSTGLGWAWVLGSYPLSEMILRCEALVLAGLDAWRIPTIDDARSLASGCSLDCPLADPECLHHACGFDARCEFCPAGGGPNEGLYCKPDTLCTHFHTSSLCGDCPEGSDWVYSPGNAFFFPADPLDRYTTVCVLPDVPDPSAGLAAAARGR